MINKKGFTLIELLVVITIIGIMSLFIYAPYGYYQKKVKIKQTKKEISQILYESRNKAINGFSSGSNLSIGVYFDSNASGNEQIKVLSYPFSFTGSQISNTIGGDIKLIEKINLQPGITIDGVSGKSNGLLFFSAVHGIGEYYFWDSGTRNQFSSDSLDIGFSYMGATGGPLKSKIEYFTKTNISDY